MHIRSKDTPAFSGLTAFHIAMLSYVQGHLCL
jgi:hypothetical protein